MAETPYRLYCKHRARCGRKDASGHVIRMLLTFEEWYKIWLDSGHWHERGRKRGQYVMSRFNDLGDYAIGNVFIQTCSQNMADSNYVCQSRPKPWVAEVNLTQKGKPCTVDGVTIYPSRRELLRHLGDGKYGGRSVSFRYV